MSQRDTLIVRLRCGGTVGAILTCPLEVVKTRLQSSSVTLYISEVQLSTMAGASVNRVVSPGPLHCLKVILEKEGPRSLFRGLGPNLVGVAPSRAIYFAAYSNCKEKLNGLFDPDSTQVHMISAAMAAIYFAAYSNCKEKLNGLFDPDSTQVHMISAAMAVHFKHVCLGFTAITATNPIWLIKTRLQLDARNRGEKRMGAFECVRKVYQTDGLRGFYRGMSASYAGISETVIHFVIYESIKQKLLEYKIASTMENEEESVKEVSDFVGMMLAAATSKTFVRTRLREEGTKYRSFFQTLSLLVQEEGYGSLYRGLTTHLVRQIPNTAIMMATYELGFPFKAGGTRRRANDCHRTVLAAPSAPIIENPLPPLSAPFVHHLSGRGAACRLDPTCSPPPTWGCPGASLRTMQDAFRGDQGQVSALYLPGKPSPSQPSPDGPLAEPLAGDIKGRLCGQE
ncbi:SLC25A36, partial [Cervus elaphus hippelaphus]